MRKMIIVGVAALTLVCMSSFATISVQWDTNGGIIQLNDAATSLPVGSIAQLIWSLDNAISPIDPFDPLTPQGGEVLLWNFTIVNAGFIFNNAANYVESDYGFADPATNYFANGYVYTRVFNFLAVDGTPTGGTWYGEGIVPLSGPALSQHTTGIPPTSTLADITELGNFSLDQQLAIPEPATWALGFLGLGVVMLRRRLMRK